MAYSKEEVQRVRQAVRSGTKLVTPVLDGTNLSIHIFELGDAVTKVSFQASDNLAGTIEFSINGINWTSSTAIPSSNAIGSYSTNIITAIRVTRVSGTGRLEIAAK